MRTLILATLLTLPAMLTGCGGTNYGVFATSTTLGIDADAKAGKIALGYDRTEGFIGPSYPENGTAPSVFGFIESDQRCSPPRSSSSTPPAQPPTWSPRTSRP